MDRAAFSRDKAWILTCGSDSGRVDLWSTADGTRRVGLEGFDEPIACAVFSPDDRLVVAGSMLGSVAVWDVATARLLRRIPAHRRSVTCLAFAPDGRTLLTGSADETARRWDLATGRPLNCYQAGGAPPVADLVFDPGGRMIVVERNGIVRVRDGVRGKEISQAAALPPDSLLTACCFSASGQQALVAGSAETTLWGEMASEIMYDGGYLGSRTNLTLWDTAAGRASLSVQSPLAAAIQTAAFNADRNELVTLHAGGQTVRWKLKVKVAEKVAETEVIAKAPGENAQFALSLAIAPDLQRMIVAPRTFGSVEVWDATRQAPLWTLPNRVDYWVDKLVPQAYATLSAAFSPDGQRIVMTSPDDKELLVLDAATGALRCRLTGHSGPIRAWTFAPDGKILATASADGSVRTWDAATGTPQKVLPGHKPQATCVAFWPSGGWLASGGADGTVRIWHLASGREASHFAVEIPAPKWAMPQDPRWPRPEDKSARVVVEDVRFSPDGQTILTLASRHTGRFEQWSAYQVWDTHTGRLVAKLETLWATNDYLPTTIAFSPSGRLLLGWDPDNEEAVLWNAATGKAEHVLHGHVPGVRAAGFLNEGRIVFTCSGDGRTRLWDASTGVELCALIAFTNGGWAVIDPDGRFDAANGRDFSGLHWVLDNEPIEMAQLGERYFAPGLLATKLGLEGSGPLLDVKTIGDSKRHPLVEVVPPGPGSSEAVVRLTNRGGGLGRVMVKINHKELLADARGESFNPQVPQATLKVDLASDLLVPGEVNRIEVLASNLEGSLWSHRINVLASNAEGAVQSRGMDFRYLAPGALQSEPPHLWAMVAGVSTYRGRDIDLHYAAKDAEDFAYALRIAAGRLFGPQNVHLTLLSTSPTAYPGLTPSPPTQPNLLAALQQLTRAKPQDIVVIYLAGHGVALGGDRGEFYFLTSEALSTDLASADEGVRRRAAISSSEIIDRLKHTAAQNRVLILDTCASGRLAEQVKQQIADPREISLNSQRWALERIKGRAGVHILAGCAWDRASYEASAYAQGLLTHSVLFGMSGAALRADQYVDVSRLFQFVRDEVPLLAGEIHHVQQPQVFEPPEGSVDIGQLTAEDKSRIPLQQRRPSVARPNFQDNEYLADRLGLGQRLMDLMREEKARGREARLEFVDTPQCPGGWSVAGRYTQTGERVSVKIVMARDERYLDPFSIEGPAAKPDDLAREIFDGVLSRLPSPPARPRP